MTTVQTTAQQDIFAPISADLDRVVEVITALSIEEIERCPAGIDALDTLDQRLAHVMETPGKKMRPAMTLLASKLWGVAPDEKVISMAVAVELLHVAALIHDDTVDDADVSAAAKRRQDFCGAITLRCCWATMCLPRPRNSFAIRVRFASSAASPRLSPS